MSRIEQVDRFLAVSFLYLRLADRNSGKYSLEEFRELIEAVNGESGPRLDPDQRAVKHSRHFPAR